MKHLTKIFLIITLMYNTGCYSKKEIINNPAMIELKFVEQEKNCPKKYQSKDFPGPIFLAVGIDTIEIGKHTAAINFSFETIVDKESKLIAINDSFAIKFFHMESTEYGELIHYIRFDLYKKDNNCWESLFEHDYSKLLLLSHFGPTTVSIGNKNDSYFKRLVYRINRSK